PYHEHYKSQVRKAADLLRRAASFADDVGLKNYLNLRATALETDNYFESDIAWMDMKTNRLDLVIGPIENYEDELFAYKTAYSAYVLVKETEWSQKQEKYDAYIQELQ